MSEQDGILSSALPIFSIMIDMCMFYYFDDHFEKKRYNNNNKHSNNAIPSLKENQCLRETSFFKELNRYDDEILFIYYVELKLIYRITLKFLLENKIS